MLATFGSEGDISNICNFGWYKWVYYRDHGNFPENKQELGHVLGPMQNEGNEMAQGVLNSKAKIVSRHTICKLGTEKNKRRIFDDIISKKLGVSMVFPPNLLDTSYVPYADVLSQRPFNFLMIMIILILMAPLFLKSLSLIDGFMLSYIASTGEYAQCQGYWPAVQRQRWQH